MASEIKVDTIVNAGGDNDTGIDLATNDQILLKVANATKLTMNSTGQTTIVGEGGTTTTSVQQGLVKTWVSFGGSSATVDDSFNVTSIDYDDTGDYGVNMTNPFGSPNTGWAGSIAHTAMTNGHNAERFESKASGSVNLNIRQGNSHAGSNAGQATDPDFVMVQCSGDLA